MVIRATYNVGKIFSVIAVLLMIAGFTGSCNKKPTTISGILLFAQGEGLYDATVSAVLDGAEVADAQVDSTTGRFLVTVPKGGSYTLRLKHPKIAPFDFMSEIVLSKGDQIVLDPYPAPNEIIGDYKAAAAANADATSQSTQEAPIITYAVVKGRVQPQDATIRILRGDKVVAEGQAKGSFFAIPDVPVGTYDIEYSFPRFSPVYHRGVTITSGGANRELNAYLLFMSAIEGVNWQQGTAVASGKGELNPSLPRNQGITVACGSARAKAYRNMADILTQVQIGPGKSITSLGSGDEIKFKLTGFIQNTGQVTETKNKDGSCEVSIEIQMQGPNSVTNFIQKKAGRDRQSY